MKHVLKLILIIAAIFFAGFIVENFILELETSISPSDKTIEIFSDFFPVLVSFSIFTLTWFSYNKNRDNHSLFLGTSFLIIGIIDMIHLLSYPFLPDFITPN